MTGNRTWRPALAALVLVAVAGCGRASSPTHADLTRDEATRAAQTVADSENTNAAGSYYLAGLVPGTLEPETVNSAEFWWATLVDQNGVTRLCLRIWGGGQVHTSIRDCTEAAPATPPPPPSPPVGY